MKAVFADTFYWIALTVPRDAHHREAQAIASTIVTTEEVLAEYLTYFSRDSKHFRRKAAETVLAIMRDPTMRVIPQSHASFLAGVELYRARPDKGYSLTDCVSMSTMNQEGLTDSLTNDRHFEQEGFRALFRS